ncbi:MAG: hypothetical protein ACOX6T_04875 [Myxococcales bacterium]|jgi:hypothetical protein
MSKPSTGHLILVAIVLAIAVKIVIFPARVPDLVLPASDGSETELRDLQGKEVGGILYGSKTPCGGHEGFMAQSVAVFRLLAESPRYHVKVVYGDQTEEEARAFAEAYPDVPIVLDPEKRFADKMDIEYYATILYAPSGKILVEEEGRGLFPKPGLEAYLDEKTQ